LANEQFLSILSKINGFGDFLRNVIKDIELSILSKINVSGVDEFDRPGENHFQFYPRSTWR